MKDKLFFLIFGLLAACNNVPDDYIRVIEKAGSNGNELQKVIAYYDSLGHSEKKEAAYYLIGAMENKYFYTGDIVVGFDSIFHYIDSLRKRKVGSPENIALIRNKWDDLVQLNGVPSKRFAEKYFDYEYYKANDIIKHIDQAFVARDSILWAQGMSKEDFYTCLLPYRINTERPEIWNRIGYDTYHKVRDTTQAKDRMAAAKVIYQHVSNRLGSNTVFNAYPYDMPFSVMALGRLGVCPNLVLYTTMVMRANGLPVSIDYVPLWGSRNGAHFWCVLHLEDGSTVPFDVTRAKSFADFDYSHYRLAKVYRKVFKRHDAISLEQKMQEDIPASLLGKDEIDVTHIYTPAYDIAVELYPSVEHKNKKHAIICTFDNREWKEQSWGPIKKNNAYFDNMGTDLMYMAMLYDGGQLVPASDPFILDKSGKIRYIRPLGKQDMKLLRKFPRFPTTVTLQNLIFGAQIQGANRPDFSDAVDLYRITEIPDSIGQAVFSNSNKFRYVRILSDGDKKLSLGELIFFEDVESRFPLEGESMGFPETKQEFGSSYHSVFDGDPGTFFYSYAKGESWAGLDLKKAKRISKIRYAPRSDTNFILKGDTYELFVWDRTGWISLGKQVASSQRIDYKNTAANGLYILRNLTRGREERIFTYENEEQIWW